MKRRPRAGFESVSNLGEIQRFYMILSPGGYAKKSPNRLVVIGRHLSCVFAVLCFLEVRRIFVKIKRREFTGSMSSVIPSRFFRLNPSRLDEAKARSV